MIKKLTAFIAGAALISGCATTQTSYQYKEEHSRAYNLAKAGGLYDAKDYSIPLDQRDSLGWDATSNTILFNSGSGLGLNWGASLGLGLLTSAFEPDGVMERDSVFGWIPESQAANQKEAWQLMSDQLLSAIEESLQKSNTDYVVLNRNLHQDILFVSEYIYSSVAIVSPESGCPSVDEAERYYELCYFDVMVFEPSEDPQKIPGFVSANQTGYGFFANDEIDYSRVKLNLPKGADINRVVMFAGVSRALPSGIFIFMAPERQDEGGYSAPVILSEGEAELFITPHEG